METLVVVKKADAKKRVFKGVQLDSLAVGEKSMVCKMNYQNGDFATEHQHPHEQCGYVINTLHSFKVLISGEVIDVFTPQREDYL